MKRLIGFAVGFLLLINCAFGDEIVSFGVSSGFLSGKVSEFVYDSSRTKSDNHLSELYWKLYAMPYSGFTFTVRPNKSFFISCDGKLAYHVTNGKLESYSYFNNYADENGWHWPGTDVGEYTNYSTHEVKLKQYYDFSGIVGGYINLPFDFEISPYFKYEYGSMLLEGNKGFEKNKRNNWKITRYKGTVLDYKVISQNIYFGFRTDISYLNPCVFYVSYELNPFLGFLTAYDNHYITEKSYKDVLDNVASMKWIFDVSYKLKGFQRIEAKCEITYLPETYGEFRRINDNDGGLKEVLTDFSVIYNVYF